MSSHNNFYWVEECLPRNHPLGLPFMVSEKTFREPYVFIPYLKVTFPFCYTLKSDRNYAVFVERLSIKCFKNVNILTQQEITPTCINVRAGP